MKIILTFHSHLECLSQYDAGQNSNQSARELSISFQTTRQSSTVIVLKLKGLPVSCDHLGIFGKSQKSDHMIKLTTRIFLIAFDISVCTPYFRLNWNYAWERNCRHNVAQLFSSLLWGVIIIFSIVQIFVDERYYKTACSAAFYTLSSTF